MSNYSGFRSLPSRGEYFPPNMKTCQVQKVNQAGNLFIKSTHGQKYLQTMQIAFTHSWVMISSMVMETTIIGTILAKVSRYAKNIICHLI